MGEWDSMKELNELASNQEKLIKKFNETKKTSNVCSIFITILDIKMDNVKNNFDELSKIDIDSLMVDASLGDCFRWAVLESYIEDIKNKE